MSNTTLASLVADDTKFTAWLESKPLSSVVGYVHQAYSCPIVSYIKEMGATLIEQNEIVRVRWTIAIGRPNEDDPDDNGFYPRLSIGLPDWVRKFIRIVDEGVTGDPITARVALDALHKV